MQRTTFVIPRESRDEVTFAAVIVELTDEAARQGLAGANAFLGALRHAVTRWVKTTERGREAWENSSEDFNVGDLANEDLDDINGILSSHGARIVDVVAYSMDASAESWTFDTVLVDGEEL